MNVIDESRAKILPDGSNPSTKPDILTVRSVNSSFKCVVNVVGDEVEGRASTHFDRCTGVIGEYENRSVVRRIIAPPSLPSVVWPGSSDRSEHVSTNDPRSYIVEAACHKIIVNTSSAAILVYLLLKGACAERPLVQCHTADTKWIVEILMGTGTVAIEGDRKAVDTKPRHKLNQVQRPFDSAALFLNLFLQ